MNLAELVYGALQPSNSLVLLCALGVLLSLRWRWTGTAVAALGVVLLLGIGLLPVGQAMLRPLEARFPADPPIGSPPDGIILLGGYITQELSPAPGDLALNEAAERVTATVALARRFPDAKVIVTDGTADPEMPSAAEATVPLLEALGLPRERMVLETRAQSTRDNAVFSRELVPAKEGERYVLVTSAWHMPRSVATFAAAGWEGIIPWPVDYATTHKPLSEAPLGPVSKGLRQFDIAVRENLATIAYGASAWLD